MLNIGNEICNYMDACIEFYHKEDCQIYTKKVFDFLDETIKNITEK